MDEPDAVRQLKKSPFGTHSPRIPNHSTCEINTLTGVFGRKTRYHQINFVLPIAIGLAQLSFLKVAYWAIFIA
jgi:hypothetical protein